ncbi:MAG: alpha/beta fold hydrolase [Pseudomonadota bacterium]|nr:alpha/beta fold hydrolase [Pseudomonadota bacterium]
MRHPPLAPGWIDRPHLRVDIGDLPLESGAVLHDTFVTTVVHGQPARPGTAAILGLTAIGSTHHRLDFLIGPGAPLDSERFCIVVIDALGNGLSSSPSNSAHRPGAAFPAITIRDMVESQRRALDQLGIGRLGAVVGASMGGMQALQWAVSHPARMDRVVAMTPMARTSRWSQLVNEMARRALFADAACRVPRPRAEAMRLWVPLTQMVMARSPEAVQELPSRAALEASLAAAEAELAEHGPDPFDWACQSRAYDDHDVGATAGFDGDTARALASIAAEVLIATPASDLYNPPFSAHETATGIRRSRTVVLLGEDGHRSASGVGPASTAALRQAIAEFLR